MLYVVRSKVVFLRGKIASLRLCVRRGWPVMTGEGKKLLYFLCFFPTVGGGKARASDASLLSLNLSSAIVSVRAKYGGRTTTVT